MTKEYYLVTVLSTSPGFRDSYMTYSINCSPTDHLIEMRKAVTIESEIKFVLIYSEPITKDQYNTLRLNTKLPG